MHANKSDASKDEKSKTIIIKICMAKSRYFNDSNATIKGRKMNRNVELKFFVKISKLVNLNLLESKWLKKFDEEKFDLLCKFVWRMFDISNFMIWKIESKSKKRKNQTKKKTINHNNMYDEKSISQRSQTEIRDN